MDMSLKLYRLPEVCELIGLRRSAIYAAIARGEFPAPVRISKRASAWRHTDLEAWIAERAAEREGRQ